MLSVVLVMLVAEFFSASKAAFTTPLTVNFSFPLTTIGSLQIEGSGVQQVFRSGSVPASGIFSGLDPKNGIAPSGTTLKFVYPNSAPIVGINDFVYAVQITNHTNSTGPIINAAIGSCLESSITSIGYIDDSSGAVVKPSSIAITGGTITATFIPTIGVNQKSAIIFYTSPSPPSLVTASILGGKGASTTSINSDKKLYGACPVDLITDIKAGCSIASLPDTPVTAISGSMVAYRILVENSGTTTLTNLVITEALTNTNINSQFLVGGLAFTGTLQPGETAVANFTETATTSGTKNINVAGEYVIPNQDGTPSSQTFPLPGSNSILTDSINVAVIQAPSLTSSFSISPANFMTLPQTLTYSLKATNTGSSSLSTTFDLDAKLKALLTAPPSGVTISSPVSFPTAAQTIAAGSMRTQQFTITVNTLAGWQALADALDPKKSSSELTVNASIVGLSSTVCGMANMTQTVPASTTFTPPCKLEALKTVACDLGTGTPPNSNFSATAIVLKNSSVYYRYKVTNSSLLDTINNINLTDPLLPAVVPIGTLAPGEMKTVDVLATMPAIIPANLTITVNGACAQETVATTAPSGLAIAEPAVAASKTVNGSVDLTNYIPGTELVWTLTATNSASSGIPLNLTIDDPILRGIAGVTFKLGSSNVSLPYTANSVAAGASVTIKASVTFNTANDFKAVAGIDEVLRNTVTVNGVIVGSLCGRPDLAKLQSNAVSTVRLFTPPTTEICIIRTCEPNCPPPPAGSEPAMKAPFSDDKPGSLLLYNLYTSSSSGDAAQNTRLTLTNLGPSTTFAHLFFVDGASCNVSDTFACLSPNQTSSFLASEVDPGVTGYVVALAVNEEGCPVSFNYLIGSAHVKFASGHSAQLNAQAVAALYSGVLNNCTSSISETVIKLDGIDYGEAPATLVADTIFSQADKQSTMLIVNPVGGNFNSPDSVKTIGTLSGQVFDEAEKGYSFVASVNRCQLRETMSDSFPRIPLRLSKVIRSGTVGMMRFATNDKAPIAGSIITFNPDVKLNASGFNQGHNLQFSALTNIATYTIPIFRPHV